MFLVGVEDEIECPVAQFDLEVEQGQEHTSTMILSMI